VVLVQETTVITFLSRLTRDQETPGPPGKNRLVVVIQSWTASQTFTNRLFAAPHRGHLQFAGRSSKAVFGSTPRAESPIVGL
jgi:hypothetical protein